MNIRRRVTNQEKDEFLWSDCRFSILNRWENHFCHMLNMRVIKQSHLPPAFVLSSCLAYSLALKMETACSSKTLVNFQWTRQHYIPEDRTLNDTSSLIYPWTNQQNCKYCLTHYLTVEHEGSTLVIPKTTTGLESSSIHLTLHPKIIPPFLPSYYKMSTLVCNALESKANISSTECYHYS
jgi:hypothetical protein